jgi:Zn-dependent protease
MRGSSANPSMKEAPVFARLELGRIAGIDIFLDMMFVLVLLLFAYPYFTSGDTQMMSAGFIIVVGVLLSLLLHELGHAFVGKLFGARVVSIDLTGIGGVANFERSLPASVIARTLIYLAGPAVNLLLWLALNAITERTAGIGLLALPFAVLAPINFLLMLFNLLPAYPLDGGHTLDAWLAAIVGATWATRIVAGLGLAVALGLGVYAFPGSIFLIFVAVFLGQANWQALQRVRRWR